MTNRNLIVKSADQKLVVKGGIELLISISRHPFSGSYIPEYSYSWSSSKILAHFDLCIEEGKYTRFIHSDKTSILTIGKDNKLSIEDIITTIDYCLDYKRQSAGVYVVHGSACSQKKHGIVFFGAISGIGKTSTNLNMCQKFDFEFIGDEKILIDMQGYILGGTKSIFFNKPELFQWLNKDLHNRDMNTAGKIKVSSKPTKCKVFVQPVITSEGSDLLVSKWDEHKANWHLYEELTRKIRGTSRRIADYKIGLQSIDNNELTQKRISTAKLISETAHFYLIVGPKDSISNFVCESILKY